MSMKFLRVRWEGFLRKLKEFVDFVNRGCSMKSFNNQWWQHSPGVMTRETAVKTTRPASCRGRARLSIGAGCVERAGWGTGRQPAAASSTVCSIAPKMEWPWASFISIRTVSPKRRNDVLGAPDRMVSTMRSSARQE